MSSDDLSGPVGAVFDADWIFRIADGKVTSFGFGVHDQSKISFVTSMTRWLEAEYPDVFEATFAAPEGWCSMTESNCYSGKWFSSPEAAAVLLDLGPEFIAQSDRYSVES